MCSRKAVVHFTTEVVVSRPAPKMSPMVARMCRSESSSEFGSGPVLLLSKFILAWIIMSVKFVIELLLKFSWMGKVGKQ